MGDLAGSDVSNSRAETDDEQRRRIVTALAWYEPGLGMTDFQVFAMVRKMRAALADGRITPADLGIEADSMATCPKCRCLVNSPCPACSAPMILMPSGDMAICDRNTFHCYKPISAETQTTGNIAADASAQRHIGPDHPSR